MPDVWPLPRLLQTIAQVRVRANPSPSPNPNPTPNPNPKPKTLPLPLPLTLTVAQIYHDKLEAEDAEEEEAAEVTPWTDFVLAWLVRQTGLRSKAIARLNGLLYSARS